ncbi:hypothetical protein MMC09_006594 [Bachmanniomyces sp. S44760]|nr:hypothetical protein [Bachmanniomyces sp. S44760]
MPHSTRPSRRIPQGRQPAQQSNATDQQAPSYHRVERPWNQESQPTEAARFWSSSTSAQYPNSTSLDRMQRWQAESMSQQPWNNVEAVNDSNRHHHAGNGEGSSSQREGHRAASRESPASPTYRTSMEVHGGPSTDWPNYHDWERQHSSAAERTHGNGNGNGDGTEAVNSGRPERRTSSAYAEYTEGRGHGSHHGRRRPR